MKKLIVMSCPRSATRYFTKVLNGLGVDVEHERVGKDGTVSGLFFLRHMWYPASHQNEVFNINDYQIRYVLIRNPRFTVASLVENVLKSVEIVKWYREIGVKYSKNKIKFACNIWNFTYDYIFSHYNINRIVRVENIDWTSIKRDLGVTGQIPAIERIGQSNTNPLSKSDLRHIDMQLVKKMGYNL